MKHLENEQNTNLRRIEYRDKSIGQQSHNLQANLKKRYIRRETEILTIKEKIMTVWESKSRRDIQMKVSYRIASRIVKEDSNYSRQCLHFTLTNVYRVHYHITVVHYITIVYITTFISKTCATLQIKTCFYSKEFIFVTLNTQVNNVQRQFRIAYILQNFIPYKNYLLFGIIYALLENS